MTLRPDVADEVKRLVVHLVALVVVRHRQGRSCAERSLAPPAGLVYLLGRVKISAGVSRYTPNAMRETLVTARTTCRIPTTNSLASGDRVTWVGFVIQTPSDKVPRGVSARSRLATSTRLHKGLKSSHELT